MLRKIVCLVELLNQFILTMVRKEHEIGFWGSWVIGVHALFSFTNCTKDSCPVCKGSSPCQCSWLEQGSSTSWLFFFKFRAGKVSILASSVQQDFLTIWLVNDLCVSALAHFWLMSNDENKDREQSLLFISIADDLWQPLVAFYHLWIMLSKNFGRGQVSSITRRQWP